MALVRPIKCVSCGNAEMLDEKAYADARYFEHLFGWSRCSWCAREMTERLIDNSKGRELTGEAE